MKITIRKHSYSTNFPDIRETNGMYSRCIYCGETIGQGWYGTGDSNCIEREDLSDLIRYFNTRNITLLPVHERTEEEFANKRYSNIVYSKKEILEMVKNI